MSRRRNSRPPKPQRQNSFDPFSHDEGGIDDDLSSSFSQNWDLGGSHDVPATSNRRSRSNQSRGTMAYSVNSLNQVDTDVNSQYTNAASSYDGSNFGGNKSVTSSYYEASTMSTPKRNRAAIDPNAYTYHDIKPRVKKVNNKNMFQNMAFGVEVRSIDLSNKVAFEKTSIVPSEYRLNDGFSKKDTQVCSPSLLHYEVLERIHGQKHVRQLAWKSSVSYAAVCSAKSDTHHITHPQLVNVHEYLQSLPSKPPSIFKYRLPMRCDVGFPNASDAEMLLKQEEICMMAEHEEVQPRLLLLGNYFLRGSKIENSQMEQYERRYSPFAPPLDSVPSSSKMWRPRPFQDRPPGMIYLVASPLDVSIKAINEPLVGTLSLYSILNGDGSNLKSFREKVSEDFTFPAGDWGGLLKEEASRFIQESLFGTASMDSNFEDEQSEKCKKKALFSFDPLTVPNYGNSLYVLVQLFRISQADICKRKKSLFLGNNRKSSSKSVAKNMFAKFGTQFLTPCAFGVVPINVSKNIKVKWPKGQTQNIPLYSYSKTSESQEKFLERVASITKGSSSANHNKVLDGSSLRMFTSLLGSDFCQVLLQTPQELSSPSSYKSPRLLVDSTGDGAIMMNPVNDSFSVKSMRSDLVRLPPSPRPSGYLDSFEVKEVVYFPPLASDQNDPIIPLASSSFLNVMYLYPKQVSVPKNFDRHDKLLSLRVRLVQQNILSDELGSSETIRTTVDSIFNPAPGRPILQAVYTKISPVHCRPGENVIYMRDEIKIKLPAILDNSFYIQFSLFGIEVNDVNVGGMTAEILSEDIIPLSRTSEPSYKYQVTTILPNGLHFLKLGDFRIKFETKVASSVHVSDPSIATMFCHTTEIGRSLKSDKVKQDPFNLSHTDILEKASPSSIVSYFRELVFVHLFQMVKRNSPDPDNMSAIFEIISKTKSIYGESTRLNIFLKNFVDNFDELTFYLQPRDMALLSNKGSIIDSSSFFNIDADDDQSINTSRQEEILTEDAIATVEDMLLEAAIYVISFQHSRSDAANFKRSNTFSNHKEPYTRKAYGASKIEQMRAEAEIDNDDRLVQYLNDESDHSERSTYTANIQNHAYESSSVQKMNNFGDMSTIGHSKTHVSPNDFAAGQVKKNTTLNAIKDKIQKNSWSKTVTNIAQAAVAPCVAPTFAADKIFRRGRGKSVEEPFDCKQHEQSIQLYSAGSDLEDEDEMLVNVKKLSLVCDGRIGYHSCGIPFFNYPGPPKIRSLFTLLDNSMPFSLSIKDLNENSPNETGHSYVYECILFLWINTWQENIKQPKRNLSGTNSCSMQPFFSNIQFLLPLCLKSLALRISTPHIGDASDDIEMTVPCILDTMHVKVLLLLMDVLAFGAMRNAVKNYEVVLKAQSGSYLQICDETCDFLVGLLGLVHPSQVSLLIERYLTTLFISEIDEREALKMDMSTGWRRVVKLFGKNKPALVSVDSPVSKVIRANCSRKFRLRTSEKLAMIPAFVAINYPLKYSTPKKRRSPLHASWTHQLLDNDNDSISCPFEDGMDRLPRSHWLADILVSETMMICSASLDLVSSFEGKNYTFCDNVARDAIATLYEFLLKRHSLDKRFQGDIARTRIAGIFTVPMFEMTCTEVSSLIKVNPSNNIRCLWLLCFLHVCQEAPEQMIRDYLRHCCLSTDSKLSTFIRILKMCTLSFQGFIGLTSSALYGIVNDVSWLVQEAFNTICATIILVVDECSDLMLSNTQGRRAAAQGIFDLILFILTIPQSTITQARGLGAACLSIDKFGVLIFLETVGDNLQHWARILLTLLNSVELSVRSVSIDLIISIFGGAYDESGSLDDVSLVFLTVLPEVIAREVALFALRGQIESMEHVEKSLWPLRRALGEIEDTDPNDDERIDVQLDPILAIFCQACQAIVDGVLIELRLQGDTCMVAGIKIQMKANNHSVKKTKANSQFTFDADEESLYEAANIFTAEIAPMQRLRWLLTLKKLHESKGQWIEAAESSLMCANTISDAIPHISSIWRPSLFTLWRDMKCSPWLNALAKSGDSINKATVQEMIQFSENFLESPSLLHIGALREQTSSLQSTLHGKLYYPTISSLCYMLRIMSDEIIQNYSKEGPNTEMLASVRIEQLLRNVIGVVDQYCSNAVSQSQKNKRKQFANDNAALRRVSTHVNSLLAKLAESMATATSSSESNLPKKSSGIFVRVTLLGKKPDRFEEASTSIPAFMEWGNAHICRVKRSLLENITNRKHLSSSSMSIEDNICKAFADPILAAINTGGHTDSTLFCTKPPSEARLAKEGASWTFIVVTPVLMAISGPAITSKGIIQDGVSLPDDIESKQFYSRNDVNTGRKMATIIESTVAHCFPCALSRQRAIITTEYVPESR